MKLELLVATGILGFSLSCSSGCALPISEISEGEGMTLLGRGMMENDNPSIARLGSYLSLLGQMRHQKEVSREGRSQIIFDQRGQPQNLPENVLYSKGDLFPAPGYTWTNPEDLNNLSTRESLGVVFAANYYQDFDKDGMGGPDEFIGIKNKFYTTESIIFVLYDGSSQGIQREIRYEIYNPLGNKIHEDSLRTATGSVAVGANFEFTKWLFERGSYGNYVIAWHSLGMTETAEIEIIRPPSE